MNRIIQIGLQFLKQLLRFRSALFVGVVLVIYGIILFRLAGYLDAQPDKNAISSATAVAQPRIDQATVNKIKQLQDNSVNVRSLFNQARQNPFQE